MKKAVRILCIVFLCVFMIGMPAYIIWDMFSGPAETLVSQGDNFKLIRYVQDDAWYKYYFYNSEGELIFESKYGSDFQPQITQTGDLITVTNPPFTPDGSYIEYYYDIRIERLSEAFWSPIRLDNGLVLYMEKTDGDHVLIVQDMFDESMFYEEYRFGFLYYGNNPSKTLIDAVLINEHQIEVTYLSGDEFHEATTIIDIRT